MVLTAAPDVTDRFGELFELGDRIEPDKLRENMEVGIVYSHTLAEAGQQDPKAFVNHEAKFAELESEPTVLLIGHVAVEPVTTWVGMRSFTTPVHIRLSAGNVSDSPNLVVPLHSELVTEHRYGLRLKRVAAFFKLPDELAA